MPRWTYPVMDVASGRLIAEHVPFTGVRFTDTLDQGGSFSGSYPFGHPAMPVMPRDCIARLMVWPCRDGVPQGAYIITRVPNHDMQSPDSPVEGDRFDSILDHREIYHDLNFTNVEQLDIARDLCRYGVGIYTVDTDVVVADPMSPLKAVYSWFRIGGAKSDVLRTVQVSTASTTDDGYSGTKGLFVGPTLRALADASPRPGEGLKVGFEIRADYGTDPETGSLWARVTFGWPHIGRTQTDPNRIVFEYPSAAVPSCTFGADGKDFATRLRVIGRERDNVRPTGSAVNDLLHTYGYPLWDRNITSGSITESNNLGDRAASALYRKSRIASGWSVVLNPDAEPHWGTYRIGDYVILRVRRGDVQIPDQTLRIAGWTIEVDDTGDAETITPQLVEP